MNEVKNKKIGIVISGMDTTENVSFYQGICDEAKKFGYETYAHFVTQILQVSPLHFQCEFRFIDSIDFTSFDGIIVSINTIGDVETKNKILRIFDDFPVPVVVIDSDIKGAYVINQSNYKAMYEIVDHMVKVHNKKRINYVSGQFSNCECMDRLRAYKDVMIENGIYDEKRIYEGHMYVADGVEAIEQYLLDGKFHDAEAFVCANDYSALSVCEELTKIGKKIPDNVAVTGFDYTDDATDYRPILTSVSRELKYVGERTVRILNKIWNGKEVDRVEYIPSKPIFGESCGCKFDKSRIEIFTKKKFEYYSEKKMFEIFVKSCTEELFNTNSFEEYINQLRLFLNMIEPEKCLLCISDEYADIFGLEDAPFYEGFTLKKNAVKHRLALEYYSNGARLNDVFKGEKGKQSWGNLFSSRLSPDSNVNSIASLHYREKNFGFIIFRNSFFPIIEKEYEEWLLGICWSLGNLRDRVLLRNTADELNELYMRDQLTGLYNRYGLNSFFENKKEELFLSPVLFMFGDINGLKKINDNYGHEEGNYTISSIALAIKHACKNNLLTVRYGGDEFLIVGINKDYDDYEQIEKNIQNEIDKLNKMNNKPYELSICFGGYVKEPKNSDELIDIINKADSRMYTKKRR